MKDRLYLILFVIFFSCQSNKIAKNRVVDYIGWDITDSTYREFQHKTDSTITIVFIQQKVRKINDTVWEFEFNWIRSDSLPINKSIERYSKNNTLEFIGHSYYVADSLKNSVEIKAEIIGKKEFSLNRPFGSCDLKYKFPSDTNLTMKVHSDFIHKFLSIDSLGKKGLDCLVITSNDLTTLEYSDNRKDTIITTKSIKVYAKGQGLICYGQSSKENNVWFKLKE